METKQIIIGEFINLGKSYWSKCGNKVKISRRKEITGGYEYAGQIIETISGHEILLNKTHWYDEKGKWIKNKGGIHDLSRECI